MIAIVERSAPDVLLVLHDFATGRTWPAGDFRERDAVGTALLEQLRTIRAGTYYLKSHVSGARQLKVR
jgi:hypothetical protein